MKLLIQGNNITVTDAIHDYVQQKLERAVKHHQSITSKVDVHLSVARNTRIVDKHKAEVMFMPMEPSFGPRKAVIIFTPALTLFLIRLRANFANIKSASRIKRFGLILRQKGW